MARDLIDSMIVVNSEERFDVKDCLTHPYFWCLEKQRLVGKDVFLERAYKGEFKIKDDKPIKEIFKGNSQWDSLVDPNLRDWAEKFDPKSKKSQQATTKKHQQYNYKSVKDLIRMLGNFIKHSNEKTNPIPKGLLADQQDPFDYVVKNFPELMKWVGKGWHLRKQKEKKLQMDVLKPTPPTENSNEGKSEVQK